MNVSPHAETTGKPPGLPVVPWLCLVAAVGWSILLRVPLVLNAAAHLDSDLAVDGLTLLEAVQGHWRWHYPGTPHVGTGPVFLSWLQARIWGVDPMTLVSGGTVAYILLVVAVFAMAWRVFGRSVAIGSLVPLAFASTGTLWLSGRITGGHLLIAAWSAGAWLLLHKVVTRTGRFPAMLLGLWCGLGVYLDSMFVMTLAGMVFAGLIGVILVGLGREGSGPGEVPLKDGRPWASRLAKGLVLVVAFVVGSAPRSIGKWVEPYDAYNEQFAWSLAPNLLAGHSRILLLECLPRLIAGHRLPGLEADPEPALLGSAAPIQASTANRDLFRWWTLVLTILALGCFAAALLALAGIALKSHAISQRTVAAGILAWALAVAAGFLVNRNIFNSDNYCYLVLVLIPWWVGFGLLLERAIHLQGPGMWAGLACVIALAVLFTCDAAAWYRRLGWIDERFQLVRQRLDDPALRWLAGHPEVRSIQASYWDVYRLSFLTGGEVKGVPFPVDPNRFPEWSAAVSGGRPETLVVRRSPEGRLFLDCAIREGGTLLHREGGLMILHWPCRAPELKSR